jgi:hypothetical protein
MVGLLMIINMEFATSLTFSPMVFHNEFQPFPLLKASRTRRLGLAPSACQRLYEDYGATMRGAATFSRRGRAGTWGDSCGVSIFEEFDIGNDQDY